MVQRDQIPEGVNDIEQYKLLVNALEDSNVTINTDGETVDIDQQDILDVLANFAHSPPIGDMFRTHSYGTQPDGDHVEDKASGVVNSFDGELAIGEEVTVTDGFVDSDGWSSIEVFVSADNPSAVNGVKVDYTDNVTDGGVVQATRTKTFTGDTVTKGFTTFKFETDLDGFRVRYENDGEATSDITITITLRTEPAPDSANYVGKNTLGENFVRVGTNEASDGLKIGDPTSLFGDINTIERRTLVDVASSFGTSTLRDESDSTGSGVIAENPSESGEIVLSTGTTANSDINLRTAAYGRYTPGYSAQAGVGVRFPDFDNFTEGEARWGYFGDSEDGGSGFYFGYDASQNELFVALLDNGVEKKRIYQSNWNGQDFENVYDKTLNPEVGYIYQIEYSWYGYGVVNFNIVSQTSDTISAETPRQETITVHSLVVEGDTTIDDPNEPIRIELENAGDGVDNRLAIGGRQFSVYGEESEERRITGDTRFDVTVNNGEWTYVMSWQRGNTVGNNANARLDFNGMDFSIDQTCKIALVLNADVTGTTYNLPTLTPNDETLLEVSKAGTFNGIGANGRKVWEGSVAVAGTGQARESINIDAEIDFGQNGELTLIVQPQGGNGSVDTTMRLDEDW